MIFKEYTEIYKEKVYNFIYNTMSEELDIDKFTLNRITHDLRDIRNNYLAKNGNIWLAINDLNDEVVGTIAVVENIKGIGELKRFYVSKECRGQKIGAKLYEIAEEYSLLKSFKKMYLVSGKELIVAHRIYEKNGWREVDNETEKVDIAIRNGAYLYRKDISEKNEVYPRLYACA